MRLCMCGRYLLHADPKLIERAFGAEFSQIPARGYGRTWVTAM